MLSSSAARAAAAAAAAAAADASAAGRGPAASQAGAAEELRCPQDHVLVDFVVASPSDASACVACSSRPGLRARMKGCRRCSYDLCWSCATSSAAPAPAHAPAPAPSPPPARSPAPPPALVRPTCPNHHPLAAFLTHHSSFTCDGCHSRMRMQELLMGCRLCNWDLCTRCYSARTFAPEGPSLEEWLFQHLHLLACEPGAASGQGSGSASRSAPASGRYPRASTTAEPASASTSSASAGARAGGGATEEPIPDALLCMICMQRRVSQRLACGHLLCKECSFVVMSTTKKCPVDRISLSKAPQVVYI